MAAVTLSACLDLPEIQHETSEARIGVEEGIVLCAADLDRIDRQIAFVEDMLDADSDDKVEIYIYEGTPPRCYGGLSCYDARRKMVRTNLSSLDHEVVHAVVDRFAQPTPFWSEGIAAALDANGTHRGVSTVLEASRADHTFELDYATAGHFTRWLLEEYDPVAFRPVLEGASFTELYGLPFADAAQRFEAEQPFSYPPWFECDDAPLATSRTGWAESFEIGCDDLGGSGVRGGPLSVTRVVDLEPGRYEIETTGGLGTRLLGCQLDAFAEEPPAMFHGDVPNGVESSQTHPGVLFASGDPHIFEITVGGSFMSVSMADDSTEAVELRLDRLGR